MIELEGTRNIMMFTIVNACLLTRTESSSTSARPLNAKLMDEVDRGYRRLYAAGTRLAGGGRRPSGQLRSPGADPGPARYILYGPEWDNDELAEITTDLMILKSVTDSNELLHKVGGNPIRRDLLYRVTRSTATNTYSG